MLVPSTNILNMAMSVIGKQTVAYFKYVSRTNNAIGNDITNYASPVPVSGSWQPVPRNMYEKEGLDLTKIYYNFYASKDMLDVHRDVSGDQLEIYGKRYQVLSEAGSWFNIDGWDGVLCVEIGPALPPTPDAFFGFENHENFDNGNFGA